jgi:archaellum component FlaF (FlaF/FlaG flagellin family)
VTKAMVTSYKKLETLMETVSKKKLTQNNTEISSDEVNSQYLQTGTQTTGDLPKTGQTTVKTEKQEVVTDREGITSTFTLETLTK